MTTPEAFGLYSFVTHMKKPEWGIGSIRKSEGDAYHILFPKKDKAEAGDDILARDRDLFRLERACAANNCKPPAHPSTQRIILRSFSVFWPGERGWRVRRRGDNMWRPGRQVG